METPERREESEMGKVLPLLEAAEALLRQGEIDDEYWHARAQLIRSAAFERMVVEANRRQGCFPVVPVERVWVEESTPAGCLPPPVPNSVYCEALEVIAACLDDDQKTQLLFLGADATLRLEQPGALEDLRLVDEAGQLTALGWSVSRIILREDPDAHGG